MYGGGGYVAQLRGDRAALFQKIKDLKAGGWIDKYTRAVFLEFSVYNANVSKCILAIPSVLFTLFISELF